MLLCCYYDVIVMLCCYCAVIIMLLWCYYYILLLWCYYAVIYMLLWFYYKNTEKTRHQFWFLLSCSFMYFFQNIQCWCYMSWLCSGAVQMVKQVFFFYFIVYAHVACCASPLMHCEVQRSERDVRFVFQLRSFHENAAAPEDSDGFDLRWPFVLGIDWNSRSVGSSPDS